MAYKLNGNSLPLDVAFSYNDINYPANWLRHATISQKNAIGITEVAEPASYDQRFYSGPDKPKDLATRMRSASEIVLPLSPKIIGAILAKRRRPFVTKLSLSDKSAPPKS